MCKAPNDFEIIISEAIFLKNKHFRCVCRNTTLKEVKRKKILKIGKIYKRQKQSKYWPTLNVPSVLAYFSTK